jgi:hypothetical protein
MVTRRPGTDEGAEPFAGLFVKTEEAGLPAIFPGCPDEDFAVAYHGAAGGKAAKLGNPLDVLGCAEIHVICIVVYGAIGPIGQGLIAYGGHIAGGLSTPLGPVSAADRTGVSRKKGAGAQDHHSPACDGCHGEVLQQ